MLDLHSRALVENSALPTQLTGSEARDYLANAYIQWLAKNIFDTPEEINLFQYSDYLGRLSLATSILQTTDPEISTPTAFVTAEAGDIGLIYTPSSRDVEFHKQFRQAIHLLDIASYFHLSDYDANANLLGKRALGFLKDDLVKSLITSGPMLSYYRCLAYFLRGQFGHCREEASRVIVSDTAQDRAFTFLRLYINNLTYGYQGVQLPSDEDKYRITDLANVLRASDHAYFALLSETERLALFTHVLSRKAIYPILLPIFQKERGYINERLSGENNRGYPFGWPPTREFCEQYFIENGRHAIITVPTGGGKSFLAELAVAYALKEGWVLYLAPTNALCSQIQKELQNNLAGLENVGIEAFLGGLEYLGELPTVHPQQNVIVMTPEKASLLSKLDSARFSNCVLVVLDECHILGEHGRGEIAESILSFCIAANPDVRIIMMSALVSNGSELADWLERRTGQPVGRIFQNWRPTRTARFTVLPAWETLVRFVQDDGKVKYSVGINAFADTVTPWEESTPLLQWPIGVNLISNNQTNFSWVNSISRALAQRFTEKGLRTLLFVLKSKHHAFSIGRDFAANLPPRPEESEMERNQYTIAEYELGAESVVRGLVNQQGVAVHTAVMLHCERNASEKAFEDGRARVLIATGTLSQGLNLAAEAVIIGGTEFSRHSDDNEDPSELSRRSLNQVLNAAGRAARANIASRGLTVIVPDNDDPIRSRNIKQALLNRVRVLGFRDASLPVTSTIGDLLKKVEVDHIESQPNRDELLLISRLPHDRDLLTRTILLSFGGIGLGEDRLGRINERLQFILDDAIQRGYQGWVINAGTLSGFPFPVAEHLRNFITRISSEPDFSPPQDTYDGWVEILIQWLRNLYPWITWPMVKLHIKAWRYTRGKKEDHDPDTSTLLSDSGYPETVTPKMEENLAIIWNNLSDVLNRWVQNDTYLQLAQALKRRPCPEDKESARTDARQYLPTAINWSQKVIDQASRFAGVLLALRDQWVFNEEGTIPEWYSQATSLNTFPLGLRSGVNGPAALALFRYLLRERRLANLLSTLTPTKLDDPVNPQAALHYVAQAREWLMEDTSHDQEIPVLIAMRQLIRDNLR